jgi:GNAT superfamily N-acetyltransferase
MKRGPFTTPARSADISCRIVRSIDDFLSACAVRAAVYLAEEECPHAEEYDGNDFCAAHFLGFVNGEPAGTIRVRFFGGFAKFERLAVRAEFRARGLASLMINEAKSYCGRKGFGEILAHVRRDRVSLWRAHGFECRADTKEFVFSDYSYIEMRCALKIGEVESSLHSNPYWVIRPENDWHKPGVLEHSATRPTRSTHAKRRAVHAA